LCNEAKIEFRDGVYDRIGEPTEAALKVLVEKIGHTGLSRSSDPSAMATQSNNYWSSLYSCLSILEFNRDRKSMSVLMKPTNEDSKVKYKNVLFVKGASEMVAARCNRLKLEDGKIITITPSIRQQLLDKFDEMARKPLRLCTKLFFLILLTLKLFLGV
jgi:magnesium-transporting ATPase (P-type)